MTASRDGEELTVSRFNISSAELNVRIVVMSSSGNERSVGEPSIINEWSQKNDYDEKGVLDGRYDEYNARALHEAPPHIRSLPIARAL